MQNLDIPPPPLTGYDPVPICRPVSLPPELIVGAAQFAVDHNPANNVHVASATADAALRSLQDPLHIASLIGKAWKAGVTIPVGFLESTPKDLQDRILSHIRAWHTEAGANIDFALSADPWIRITREGEGYWSYIGTDIMSISAGEPTMSLQGFTMSTPESEYRRVVRHEAGHSCSFVHEHSRREIVALLDPTKTIRYFEATQGWSEAMIRAQILTPIEESSVMGTPHAEQDSLMAYQFVGACTKSGQPIVGGVDITPDDAAFARKLFPGLTVTPPTPAPPPQPAPPGPRPAAAPQLRGSVGPAGKPFLVYVTDPAVGSAELGYRFRGKAWISERDHVTIVYKGQADRLPTAGAGSLPADLAAVEVPEADD